MSAHAIPLETISDSGKAPEYRIKTASDARSIVAKLIEVGQDRSKWNAKVKGQIDGNPPFSQNKLKSAGQAWRTNINFMEAKSAASSSIVPDYDLFSAARYYANVRTYYGSIDDREFYSGVITEEFDCMMKKFKGFDFNMQQMLYERKIYGRGFLIFEDDKDWYFKCKPQHRVYVPDGTDAYTGNVDVLVIRERMRVHKLWAYIKGKDKGSSSGWKSSEVVKAIRNAQPEIAENAATSFNYEYLQQQIKDRDIVEGVRCATVPIAYVLTREFDGTITMQIVEEYDANRNKSGKNESLSDDFLYEKRGYAYELCQFMSAFFLETADGSWNGASGLGRDIYSLMAIKDRVKCAAMDLVFLRTGITLSAKTEDAHTKGTLIQTGCFNIIPSGFDVQQSQVLGDIESPFTADRYLDNMVASNTGVYRTQIDKPEGNPRTLGEVQMQYQTQATLGNSAVNRLYQELDRHYEEVYRRASKKDQGDTAAGKMAKEFQKRCTERGVPREAFEQIEYVRAYRNSGNGSMQLRQQNLAQMVATGLVDRMPESGKEHWVEDTIASLNGQAMVERYYPTREKLKLPNEHQSVAMLENAAMKIGAPVVWTPTQNNVIHAQTHLQAGAQAASSMQQGGNPKEVASFMDAIGQHTAIHLQELAKDPSRKQETKMLGEQWQQLAKTHDQLLSHIEGQDEEAKQNELDQQRAQSINDGTDPMVQIKAAESGSKIKMAQQKTDAGLAMKAQKQAQSLALADAATASKIRRSSQ